MEIELKYLISETSLIDKIFSDATLMKIKDADSEEKIEMKAVYFDTEDRKLFREGIAFRVRREGKKIISTLKWNGSSEDGMHKREEINVPVDNEKNLVTPDIHIFDQSEMSEVLKNVVGSRKLIPLIQVSFLRRQMRLDTGKCICELSIDEGKISCGQKSAPISELEIELYSGDENDMRELGKDISTRYNLSPEDTSKYKRGLDLL